jgi:hypothetical protein
MNKCCIVRFILVLQHSYQRCISPLHEPIIIVKSFYHIGSVSDFKNVRHLDNYYVGSAGWWEV